MNEMPDSDRQRFSTESRAYPGFAGAGPRHRWNDLLGRGIFETAIVAVGVLLALMVDQWREDAERKGLADEARSAIRAELLINREALIQRMTITSNVLAASNANPTQVAQYVSERRNRPLLTYDAAWTMTIETGAIRWLEPSERTRLATVYGGHERLREVISHELVRWTELAAFADSVESRETSERRTQALRVWQAFAQRSQFALCMNLGRHEQGLGAQIPYVPLSQFCAAWQATDPPQALYREWRKLGWVSSTLPRSIATAGQPPA